MFLNKMYDRFSSFAENNRHPLLTVFLIGLAIRVLLLPFTFNHEMYNWSVSLAVTDNGFGLYGIDGYWYTPVWGYVMALSQGIGQLFGMTDYGAMVPEFLPYRGGPFSIVQYVTTLQFNMIVKLPLMIADVVTAWLLYIFVLKVTESRPKAILAFGLWFLCPLTIVESSVHGMFDNIAAMFLMFTFLATYEKKYFLAGFAFAFSVLTKFFPLFFVFFLIVWVFRSEGWGKEGTKKLFTAVAGSIAGFVLIYIPIMAKGGFIESWRFLYGRMGLSTEKVMEILTPTRAAILAAVLIVFAIALYFLFKRYANGIRDRLMSMDVAKRNIRFGVFLLMLGIISIVAVLIVPLIMGKINLDNIVSKVMILQSVVSLLLELYIAYLFAFAKEKSIAKTLTAMFVSSSAIFFWVNSIWYLVLIIPAAAIYMTCVNRKVWVPFALFAALAALYDLAMYNITAMFSLAVFTQFVSLDWIISAVGGIYDSSVFGMNAQLLVNLILQITTSVALLSIPVIWAKNELKKVRS